MKYLRHDGYEWGYWINFTCYVYDWIELRMTKLECAWTNDNY